MRIPLSPAPMPPSTSLILALDIGTSSSRAALFDTDGQRLEGTTAQRTYPLLTSAEGAAEIEPDVLLGAVRECIAETLARYRGDVALRNRTILGVGVSCFWHSFIGTDRDGKPVTRVITWADSRCREDAAELRATFREKTTHARTGCMLRASFWPAKLRWLKRTHSKVFARVRRWMSPAEWLQLELCGSSTCAIGMATGTGLFNPTKLAWDPELLAHCNLAEEQLQPLTDEPSLVGGALAAAHPELAGIPWFPGIGDGAASNLGSGATQPGLAAINVGTSAALRVMHEGRVARAPFGLFAYRVDAQRFVVGGAVSNAGNLRAWCLRELKLSEDAELEGELASRPGPAPGLTVLPFWTTERAPNWNEEVNGAICGLTQSTSALDLLQAITDASYHRIARIAELVVETESTVPKFIVSGGVQRSSVAIQRLADVLGHPLYPNDEMEASIRGAAIYAIEKLGLPAPGAQFGKPIRPRTKWARIYAAERQRQIRLEALLTKGKL